MAIAGFEDQVNCQLIVEPYVSGDAAGSRVYGSPTTYDCIQQGPSNRAFMVNGEAIFDRIVARVGPELTELDPRSRISFEGGHAGPDVTQPRILSADSMTLNGELYYWEIHIA